MHVPWQGATLNAVSQRQHLVRQEASCERNHSVNAWPQVQTPPLVQTLTRDSTQPQIQSSLPMTLKPPLVSMQMPPLVQMPMPPLMKCGCSPASPADEARVHAQTASSQKRGMSALVQMRQLMAMTAPS